MADIEGLPVLPSDYFSQSYSVTPTSPVSLKFAVEEVDTVIKRAGRRGYVANDGAGDIIVVINSCQNIVVKTTEKFEFSNIRVDIISVTTLSGTQPIRVFVI